MMMHDGVAEGPPLLEPSAVPKLWAIHAVCRGLLR
jgi:hypothetical protein